MTPHDSRHQPHAADDEGYYYRGSRVGWTSSYHAPRIDIDAALRPFLDRMAAYDRQRRKLEQEGGTILDLQAITNLLSVPFVLEGRYEKIEASLAQHQAIKTALFDICDHSLKFEVRQLDSGLPAYYLCRIKRDFWSEYSMIVEDLYQSPGYPMVDRRFAKIMSGGNEVYHLRLSQFRGRVSEHLMKPAKPQRRDIDDVLYQVGRNVFQAAWHEDQRLAIMVAIHFKLVPLRNAIELLYLCLSGELCELRSSIDDSFLTFFSQIYPQSAICAFLKQLTRLDGKALNELPERAGRLYLELSRAFGSFLETDVMWGMRHVKLPLYKVLYGNYLRIYLVAPTLMSLDSVVQAAQTLKKQALAVIQEINDGGCMA